MAFLDGVGLAGTTDAENLARRNALLLSGAQAFGGAAAPIAISMGGLAGFYLLGADKSLATGTGDWFQSRCCRWARCRPRG